MAPKKAKPQKLPESVGSSKRGKDTMRDEEPREFMYAVVKTTEGEPDVLQVRRVPKPKPKADEVLVRVSYAGVNQPDIHQRVNMLPPDPARSEYLGLECSGTICDLGMPSKDKKNWRVGDKVCAITNGGSYAEYVAVPVALLPIPTASLKDAATFPQVACTVWSELFMMEWLSKGMELYNVDRVRLSQGQTLLIHRGSSGIGTFAIQMAKQQGVTVFVTAGSDEKLEVCRKLGAEVCINYHEEAFEKVVLKETGGKACALRNRTPEIKAAIVREVRKHVWPAIEAGAVKAYENRIQPFPFKSVADAHKRMEKGNFSGKILLVPGTLP